MPIYIDIDFTDIECLHECWNQNAEYHRNKSEFFREVSSNVLFQDRIEAWKNRSKIKITNIELESELIGYCISSINDNCGYIESIFIKESKRGKGFGRNVINKHIEWMKSDECERINVATVYGNEDAICFYKKLNIFPKKIIFELK